MELPMIYKKLSITNKRIVREKYVKLQNGLCYHCGSPLKDKPSENALSYDVNKKLFPPNFFKYPIHLHHSHVTGLTIGAVHNYCDGVEMTLSEIGKDIVVSTERVRQIEARALRMLRNNSHRMKFKYGKDDI